MPNKPILFVLVITATLLGIFSYQQWRGDPPVTRTDFTIPDLDGQTRTAQSFDGQLVLLNFWAPWCAPCRAEIPMLNTLQAEYGARGLQIIGPAVDQLEAIQDFVRDTAIHYPVLVNMPAVMRLQDSYDDQRLPLSVLIDRQGHVVFRHAGELKKNQIAPLIEQYL